MHHKKLKKNTPMKLMENRDFFNGPGEPAQPTVLKNAEKSAIFLSN